MDLSISPYIFTNIRRLGCNSDISLSTIVNNAIYRVIPQTTPSAASSAVFRPPFHCLRYVVPCDVKQVVPEANQLPTSQQEQERLPVVETSRRVPALLLLQAKTPSEDPTPTSTQETPEQSIVPRQAARGWDKKFPISPAGPPEEKTSDQNQRPNFSQVTQ